MSKVRATRAFLLFAACVVAGCGDTDQKPRPAPSISRAALRPIELSRTGLVDAACSAGDYLVRIQKEDGSFHYFYDAATDRVLDAEYNIVRHAGTTVSLFDLYASTKDARYLSTANRAINYLKTHFRAVTESNFVYVLDSDGKAKLGASGLALLAITRQIVWDPASADRDSALQLANHIFALQEPDGAFLSYHRITGDEPDRDSLYYPGEAMFGLLEFYKVQTNETRLLESARRGADYLIEAERQMPELPLDAWFMQALEALQKLKPDPKYVEHAIAIAEAILRDQYTTEATPERYMGDKNIGGFGPGEPRVTPAAARSEGILAAYRLALAQNDARAATFLAALKASAKFQLGHQFTKEDAGWLPDADKAAGAFRGSFSTTQVRIDYVQHNISSLLGLAQVWQ
ncbi:MAG TPA: hypothetical protein VJ063_19410 [Verrucomicrobiae bacterium]|nr:hypothetical protein [Verrucomicrobiae bacterium]